VPTDCHLRHSQHKGLVPSRVPPAVWSDGSNANVRPVTRRRMSRWLPPLISTGTPDLLSADRNAPCLLSL
jgi:hypothetical protein